MRDYLLQIIDGYLFLIEFLIDKTELFLVALASLHPALDETRPFRCQFSDEAVLFPKSLIYWRE